jgi:hypothetical protein
VNNIKFHSEGRLQLRSLMPSQKGGVKRKLACRICMKNEASHVPAKSQNRNTQFEREKEVGAGGGP